MCKKMKNDKNTLKIPVLGNCYLFTGNQKNQQQ